DLRRTASTGNRHADADCYALGASFAQGVQFGPRESVISSDLARLDRVSTGCPCAVTYLTGRTSVNDH
ncbi:MAG: hypothetical protein ACRDQZ_12485, partial [Mycobacteriales bacterium]